MGLEAAISQRFGAADWHTYYNTISSLDGVVLLLYLTRETIERESERERERGRGISEQTDNHDDDSCDSFFAITIVTKRNNFLSSRPFAA